MDYNRARRQLVDTIAPPAALSAVYQKGDGPVELQVAMLLAAEFNDLAAAYQTVRYVDRPDELVFAGFFQRQHGLSRRGLVPLPLIERRALDLLQRVYVARTKGNVRSRVFPFGTARQLRATIELLRATAPTVTINGEAVEEAAVVPDCSPALWRQIKVC